LQTRACTSSGRKRLVSCAAFVTTKPAIEYSTGHQRIRTGLAARACESRRRRGCRGLPKTSMSSRETAQPSQGSLDEKKTASSRMRFFIQPRVRGPLLASVLPACRLQIERNLVGAAGFELATPCTPCKCATRLRYAPTQTKSISGAATVWPTPPQKTVPYAPRRAFIPAASGCPEALCATQQDQVRCRQRLRRSPRADPNRRDGCAHR